MTKKSMLGDYVVRLQHSDPLYQTVLVSSPDSDFDKSVLECVSKFSDWVVVKLDAYLSRPLLQLVYQLTDKVGLSPDILLGKYQTPFGVDDQDLFDDLFDRVCNQCHLKVLIVVSNILDNEVMRELVSRYQMWMGEDFAVNLLMIGSKDEIKKLRNSEGLSFLSRAHKIN